MMQTAYFPVSSAKIHALKSPVAALVSDLFIILSSPFGLLNPQKKNKPAVRIRRLYSRNAG